MGGVGRGGGKTECIKGNDQWKSPYANRRTACPSQMQTLWPGERAPNLNLKEMEARQISIKSLDRNGIESQLFIFTQDLWQTEQGLLQFKTVG